MSNYTRDANSDSDTKGLCSDLNPEATIRSFLAGYIDVGDGCWRPNVLVTSLRCWCPIQDVGDRFNTLRKSSK